MTRIISDSIIVTENKRERKERENVSNRRAAIRRERHERDKIQKNKGKDGELLRAQSRGWENGKVIAACVCVNALSLEHGWSKEKLETFTKSLMDQSANGNAQVIDFAVQPWKNRFEERIKEHSSIVPKIPLTSVMQGIEYQHRNMAYIGCCSYVFLNLFSNFNLGSNSKGSGTLDKIINQCVIHFFDMQRNPIDYTSEKMLKRTKKLTGLSLV